MQIEDREGRRRTARSGEILRDGERLVVSINVMDARIDARPPVTGPGYRFAVPDPVRAEAFAAEGLRLRDAWRR